MYDFYDTAQAAMRLNNSVIRVNKKPIYVLDVEQIAEHGSNRTFKITYRNVGSAEHINVSNYSHHKTNQFDFKPVQLGYVNYRDGRQNHCIATSRIGARMWKIGATSRNIRAFFLGGDRWQLSEAFMLSESLYDTIQGDFPTLEKAIENSVSGNGSMAFSRDFAVGNQVLWHRFNSKVGTYKDNVLELNKDFKFLQESLDEALK